MLTEKIKETACHTGFLTPITQITIWINIFTTLALFTASYAGQMMNEAFIAVPCGN